MSTSGVVHGPGEVGVAAAVPEILSSRAYRGWTAAPHELLRMA